MGGESRPYILTLRIKYCTIPIKIRLSNAYFVEKSSYSVKEVQIMGYAPKLWAEAKKKCRLNDEDIQIAKELGIDPKSLIKNIPSKNEPWKAPVKDWLHAMYDKRKKKAEQKAHRRQKTSESK